MRILLILALLVGVCMLIGYNCSQMATGPRGRVMPPASSAQTQEWYSGGKLHQATMREWRAATYANRLATAADFIASTATSRGMRFTSMDDLRPYAEDMVAQLDELAKGGSAVDSQRVSEMAAAIMIIKDAED